MPCSIRIPLWDMHLIVPLMTAPHFSPARATVA